MIGALVTSTAAIFWEEFALEDAAKLLSCVVLLLLEITVGGAATGRKEDG